MHKLKIMADTTSVVPFWETLIAGVIASGLLSSFLTTWYERRKESKRLQLEMIEKAMAMLHRHYSETESVAMDFLHSIISNEPTKEIQSTVDPYDLHLAILKCAPYLDDEYQKYNKASVDISISIAQYKGRTQRTQERFETNVEQGNDVLKTMLDTTMTSFLSRCHRLVGIGHRFAWRQFRQSWSDFSSRFWGLR